MIVLQSMLLVIATIGLVGMFIEEDKVSLAMVFGMSSIALVVSFIFV